MLNIYFIVNYYRAGLPATVLRLPLLLRRPSCGTPPSLSLLLRVRSLAALDGALSAPG